MVMKKNAMGKNLAQSILRSFGRYMAIALIIALGSGLFVGLLMTKADMVETGQVFTDEQNMFDLRLLSSYGWTEEQIEKAQNLLGLSEVEAAKFQDVIVRMGDADEDSVYRFYSISQTINRVDLRGGRMPQAPDECLADGFRFDDSILGTQIKVAPGNDELALDALAYDTYTVVGYVSTPLYMDPNRGTTTVGSGSIDNYLYIPLDGFSTEYYTEINVTIPGAHTVYSKEYNTLLDDMTAYLEPQVQAIADSWFSDLVADAEAEYADGYQQYLDGIQELEQGRLDAQKELEDAYTQLTDAQKEIEENEALLTDGAKQISDGKNQLTDAEKDLASGRREFEKAKKDAYAQLEAGKAELDANAAQVSDGLAQVNDGLVQIEDGLVQISDGITQLEDGLPQIQDGIDQLEPILQLITPLVQTLRQMVDSLIANPDAIEEVAAWLEDLNAWIPRLEATARAELENLRSSGVIDDETAAQAEALLDRLPELEEAIRQAIVELDVDSLMSQLNDAMGQLEAMVDEYTVQLAELKAMYTEYSAQLEELYVTRTQVEQQKQELLETKQTLVDAQAAIDQGYEEWAAGKARADAEFAKAELELKNGEKQLKDARRTLESKEKELRDGRLKLEDGKIQLEEGWAEYEEGKLEAEQTIADAEAELADAAVKLAQARADIDALEAPETYVLDRNTNVGYASLDSNSDIVAGVSRVFPVFFLLIAALVCITTMSRMVNEERTQIGTMKAMGYGSGAIMSKYLIYAGTGGVLGCGLGMLAGSVVFPQIIWDAYCTMLYIEPTIQIRFDFGLCAAVMLSYSAVVLAVTWYCCHSTLKEVPAELIRPKAPTSGKKIFLEYLPFWNRLSFLNKVALRNIFRYRQRFLMMLIGIGGCTALLVTGFGLRDSISNIVSDQYEKIAKYDLEVYFDVGQTREEQLLFQAATGGQAEEVIFYHQENVEVNFQDQVREITMLGADEQIGNFIDMRLKGQTIPQPGPGEALMTIGICQTMGIDVGDTIVLRNADMKELHLTVSGIYENYVQNFAIVNPQTLADQWGGEQDRQMAMVRLRSGADLQAASVRVANLDGVMTVLLCRDNADTVGTMMSALDMVVWLVVFCAGLLAVVVLYNLINININERMREIATIKVLGFHSGETASYVFKENMVLSVIGSLAGLGLGKLLLDFVLSQVKVDALWFRSRVNLISLIFSVALTLLATLIVQFIFTFKIEKINMAEALKSVE